MMLRLCLTGRAGLLRSEKRARQPSRVEVGATASQVGCDAHSCGLPVFQMSGGYWAVCPRCRILSLVRLVRNVGFDLLEAVPLKRVFDRPNVVIACGIG